MDVEILQKNNGRFKKGHTPWSKGLKRLDISGENHPMWKGLPKTLCINCHKELTNRKTKRCIKCHGIVRRGENAYQYKGGKPKCSICGKLTTQYSSKLCKKCYGESLKGENNPFYGKKHSKEFLEWASERMKAKTGEKAIRWISDRTKLAKKQERNDSAYQDWRRQIWIRDGYKCKMANSDCCGKIEAHHILGWNTFPELRYEVNNGITLCHFHHPKKRADEARLSPYFQDIIKNLTN